MENTNKNTTKYQRCIYIIDTSEFVFQNKLVKRMKQEVYNCMNNPSLSFSSEMLSWCISNNYGYKASEFSKFTKAKKDRVSNYVINAITHEIGADIDKILQD